MMKKLFIAAFAVFAFAACNEKLGPEYTTPPVFSDVTFPPKTLTPAEEGSFKATLTSQYGLQTVMIQYFLNEENSASDVKSKIMKFNMTKDATTQVVEGRIPVQTDGTKVTYQLFALSYYGVVGVSAVGTYTVEDVIVPLPDPGK